MLNVLSSSLRVKRFQGSFIQGRWCKGMYHSKEAICHTARDNSLSAQNHPQLQPLPRRRLDGWESIAAESRPRAARCNLRREAARRRGCWAAARYGGDSLASGPLAAALTQTPPVLL